MDLRIKVAAFGAIAICLLASMSRVFCVSGQDASTEIAEARQALQAAFVTVLDAEKAGANVSGLIERLDAAGNVLTSALVAFEDENYSSALSLAASVRGLADALSLDARALNNEAVAQAQRWWVTVLVSVVGSASFIVVLFFFWRRFKRFYRGKLLGRMPEVVE